VPGGGKDGITKAYTLFMLLSLYGKLPYQCPSPVESLIPNVPKNIYKERFYLVSELTENETISLKNVSPIDNDSVYVEFSLCSPTFRSIDFKCEKSASVKPSEEILCKLKENSFNVLVRVRNINAFYDPNPNSSNYIIEVKK
jgi:hypothetical protein